MGAFHAVTVVPVDTGRTSEIFGADLDRLDVTLELPRCVARATETAEG